jgi:hypothetical protein
MSNSAKFEGRGVFNVLPESQGQHPEHLHTAGTGPEEERRAYFFPCKLTQGVSSQLFHVTSQQKNYYGVIPSP